MNEWLEQVAELVESNIPEDSDLVYRTKFDGSYLTRANMLEDVKFLADRNITEQLSQGIGFSPRQNKWFGWSHRGIAGFTIGSEVKKGDVAYIPANIHDALDRELDFWHDEEHHEKTTGEIINGDTIRITYTYNGDVPSEKLRGMISSQDIVYTPENFGRGEWIAETMGDAKQMAIDYREGIS